MFESISSIASLNFFHCNHFLSRSKTVKKGEEQREEFKNLIQEELRKGLENADIAKKEDILTSDEIRQIVREQIQQVLYEQGVFQSEEQENE